MGTVLLDALQGALADELTEAAAEAWRDVFAQAIGMHAGGVHRGAARRGAGGGRGQGGRGGRGQAEGEAAAGEPALVATVGCGQARWCWFGGGPGGASCV